jgi:serine/threonine protein phosphatase PrpC
MPSVFFENEFHPALWPHSRQSCGTQYTAGTTAVCVVVDWTNGILHCAHVGDSRALLVRRDGSVIALTEDHTGRSLTPEQREDIKRSGVAMVIGTNLFSSYVFSCDDVFLFNLSIH